MPAAPLWLLLLLPWAALVIYLLTGTRRRIPVPFLPLWKSEFGRPRRRIFELPPLAIACALLSILLAILAAAQPILPGHSHWKIILLVDQGLTMPPQVAPPQSIHPDETRYIPAQLKPAIDNALTNPAALVLLFSNQNIDRASIRLIQIVPAPIENIGITNLQIRLTPKAQAMVRIRNDSSQTSATLTLTAAPPTTIYLPPGGTEKNYFINLPSALSIIQAHITPGGAITADDDFYSVRRQTWPRLELLSPVDAPLRRMIDIYQHDRPASDNSQTLSLTTSLTNGPCILLPPPTVLAHPLPSDPITADDSPITSGINWQALPSDTNITDLPPGDWQILVRSGNQPLLATRESPNRQVWVGFHSQIWSTTPDFVVFWTKLFDWTGQGADTYSWQPVHYPDHPTPGLFSENGQPLAINAPAIPLDPPPQTDWQTELQSLQSIPPPGTPNASRPLLFAALTLLAFSALLWPRHR